jgi:hypothetical protein
MKTEIDKAGEAKDNGRLEQLEDELDLVKRVHLRPIFEASKSGSLDAAQIKLIASYIKVVDKIIRVVNLRKKDGSLGDAPSVRLVWDALKEIPEIRPLIEDPKVKRKILELVKKRLKECD